MQALITVPLGFFGTQEIILIALLVVLLFGAKKIPELMRGAGRGVKEFKDAINKDYPEEEEKKKEEDKKD
ncbi:MAG: twin-arginine translocase TatA/TatE family subunit [Rikenellaceae bacterium]|nr:twin-arginine translocase TatA/TatE family subunit [Rikenellaceae bacterium]